MCHDTGFSSPKADRLGGRRCRDLGIQQPTLWGWPLLQPSWGYQWLPLAPTVFIPENPCEDKRISPPFGWLLTGTIRKNIEVVLGPVQSTVPIIPVVSRSSQVSPVAELHTSICAWRRGNYIQKKGGFDCCLAICHWCWFRNAPNQRPSETLNDAGIPVNLLKTALQTRYVSAVCPKETWCAPTFFVYVYKCQASCIYTNGIPKVLKKKQKTAWLHAISVYSQGVLRRRAQGSFPWHPRVDCGGLGQLRAGWFLCGSKAGLPHYFGS